MGTFSYPIEVAGPDAEQSRPVEAIVNSGAFFTTLPRKLLRELGIEPTETRRFRVADDGMREMEIGNARVTIDGENVATIVAFSDDVGPPLLGDYTLIGLALAADCEKERLVPRELYLL